MQAQQIPQKRQTPTPSQFPQMPQTWQTLHRQQTSYASQSQPYPFTRRDVLEILKTPPQIGERMHTERDAEQMIKDALDSMNRYNYDFPYSSKKIRGKKLRTIKKQVYLQFICPNCEQKKFTSIVGTLQIKFIIKEIKNSNFLDPFLVQFNVRIYRMKCMKCNALATPRIYDSQLEACQIGLCLVVDQIFRNVPPPERILRGKRYIRQIHNHKEDYCQACELRECITQR